MYRIHIYTPFDMIRGQLMSFIWHQGKKHGSAVAGRHPDLATTKKSCPVILFHETRGAATGNDSPSTTANGLTETTNLYCSSFQVQATLLDPIGHSSSSSACAIYYDDDRSMRAQQTKRGERERERGEGARTHPNVANCARKKGYCRSGTSASL